MRMKKGTEGKRRGGKYEIPWYCIVWYVNSWLFVVTLVLYCRGFQQLVVCCDLGIVLSGLSTVGCLL